MKKALVLTAAAFFAAPCQAVEKVSGVTGADVIAKTPAAYHGKQVCASGRLGGGITTLAGKAPGYTTTLDNNGASINIVYFRKLAADTSREVIACGIFKEKLTLNETPFTNVLRASSITMTGAAETAAVKASTTTTAK
ncbi:MAG: hypothetical protein PHW69_01800 [Elusimicrobiaceae bacterium]|nr:hypothetical protein [Elusimicrobiaceae bacterium]